MALVVTKKDGLSIKGRGHQVDIPHGKELPEKILLEQYGEEAPRFKDALIRSNFVKDGHVAAPAGAPAAGATVPEVSKKEIVAELKTLGVVVTPKMERESKAELEALLAKTKADISAKAEVIDNPEAGQPTGDVTAPAAPAAEVAPTDEVKTDVAPVTTENAPVIPAADATQAPAAGAEG